MSDDSRIARLRRRMAEAGADAFVTAHGPNRRYLTGFHGTAGIALVTAAQAILLVDFRYVTQAEEQAPAWDRRMFEDPLETLRSAFDEAGAKRIAFESAHVSHRTFERWRAKAADVEWIPTFGWVEGLRAVKEAGEIARIEEAVALGDEVFEEILGLIRPGAKEREIALEIEIALRRRGAEGLAFPPIVASGPRGALPHAVPSDRAIERGELVVLDFGCVLNGYCSDMTRTVCVGPASQEARDLYELVLRAQRAGVEAVAPGRSGVEVDAQARRVIAEAGHGERFGHGLGHGVGLEVHEDPPRLSQRSETVLEPGMVCSVEPGVYVPGWGGIRIEDLVCVTEDGARVLTRSTKELLEL